MWFDSGLAGSKFRLAPVMGGADGLLESIDHSFGRLF
jgi:hypothetical protein